MKLRVRQAVFFLAVLAAPVVNAGNSHCTPKSEVYVEYGPDLWAGMKQNLTVALLPAPEIASIIDRSRQPLLKSPHEYGRLIVQPGHDQTEAVIYAQAAPNTQGIQIKLNSLQYQPEPKWINEKLLFVSAWWGRIAATDTIIDVSNGQIVYQEQASYARELWSGICE